MWPASALDFLRELEANNDRDWFKANRGRYDEDPVAPARELAARLGHLGEAHLFRPYNDTPFHMRPPIKEQLGLAIGYRGGRGRGRRAGRLLRGALARRPPRGARPPPAGDRPARALPRGDRRRPPRRGLRARGPDGSGRGARGAPAGAEARAARVPARPPADRPPATEGDHGPQAPRARAVAARTALPRSHRLGARRGATAGRVAGEERGSVAGARALARPPVSGSPPRPLL